MHFPNCGKQNNKFYGDNISLRLMLCMHSLLGRLIRSKPLENGTLIDQQTDSMKTNRIYKWRLFNEIIVIIYERIASQFFFFFLVRH